MATTEQRPTGAEDVAWDLSDLFAAAGDPKLEAELADVARSADAFRERYHGRIAALSAAELAEAVVERERIDSAVTRARTFAHLNFSTNTADPARGALLARIQELVAANETKLLFARLEWAALDDERAEELLADPALARWAHYLRAIRRYRPHLLSEPEEKILTEKAVTGMTAWSRLYSELLSGIRVTVAGEESGLERALAQLQSADRDTRAAAAAGITESLAPGLRTRTFVFNAMLLDKATDDRLRGYPHWLAARNLANEASGRDGRGARLRGRLPLRHPAALLPAEGGRPRPAEARRLRPGGADLDHGELHVVGGGARADPRRLRGLRARGRPDRLRLLGPGLDRRAASAPTSRSAPSARPRCRTSTRTS